MYSPMNQVMRILAFFKSRSFAIGLLSISLALTVYQLSTMTNAVYIRDGEDIILKFTIKDEAEEILQENDIATMAFDVVDFSGFSGKVAEINITRAFPITITADGITQEVMVTGGSVGDALDQVDLAINHEDMINLLPEKPIEESDHIIIQRVESTSRTEEITIPFETKSKHSSLLPKGRTKLLQAGKAGKKVLTYAYTVVDGVATDEQLISEEIVSKPITEEILVGAPTPVSSLDFGDLDANGAPTQYQKVLTNQVATGYSAGPRAWGASGMDLSAGYVAVNPNVIPYGTKMYITSPDNSFVYGYCIAADTGTGLMAGIIDVDLFYDTYLESCLSSRRNVNIYILE